MLSGPKRARIVPGHKTAYQNNSKQRYAYELAKYEECEPHCNYRGCAGQEQRIDVVGNIVFDDVHPAVKSRRFV